MRYKDNGRRKRSLALVLVGLLFVALAIFAVYKIADILIEYKAGTDTYEGLENYISIAPEIQEPSDHTPPKEETSAPEKTEPDIAWPRVDFESLQHTYPDVVGWIYIEGTTVNYPIVQGPNNDYYLYRMVDGSYNSSGSIFMDCRNSSDFSDPNTVIYGHHMNNGAMFSDLLCYKEQDYFDEHPLCLIMTPQQNYTLKFFSGYVADTDESAWDIFFASEEAYGDWLRTVWEKSMFKSDIVPEADDRVVTLSTCSYEFDGARFVVTGLLEPAE